MPSSNPLFKLKHSEAELVQPNDGLAKLAYTQLASTRSVSAASFPSGTINFKWSMSGQEWWIPGRSYLRFRVEMNQGVPGAGTTINPLVAGTAPNMNWAANLFQSLEFRVGGQRVSHIGDFVPQVSALHARLNKSKAWLDGIGASVNAWEPSSLAASARGAGGKQFFEFVWQPALSIFDVDHAMPAGDYELILTPQPSTIYKHLAFECATALTVASPPAAATEVDVKINDVFFYYATVDGDRVEQDSYMLDLSQIACQSEDAVQGQGVQKQFNVSPSTTALTVAYQDSRVNTTDMGISPSKFISYGASLAVRDSDSLTRLSVKYANQIFPKQEAELLLSATADQAIQSYIDTMIASDRYYEEGGGESLADWKARGQYYHFSVPKDGSSRSTQVSVTSSLTAGGTTRMLLFAHSRQTAHITIMDGRVSSVLLVDN